MGNSGVSDRTLNQFFSARPRSQLAWEAVDPGQVKFNQGCCECRAS
ncbi:MAG: hypothetical protein ACM37W_17350 [Actinomycetota bacterium]